MPAAELQEDFGQLIDQLQSEAKAQIAQRQRQEQSSRLTDQDIERAISGSLPKNKVSLAYRFHLAVVAAAMVTLPIIYVAMVVLAGWGVVHYVTQVIPSLTARPPVGRGMVIYFAAVATPAIVGTILVVFMIKPLFFRTTHSHRSRSLTRTAEPLIFALVDRICESTGAPKPTRIDVDYNVNASAQPSGGLLSVATGSLVLTIGVPLIAGLSARQLAGVLAHEFGHFSQKIGMGATLLIRKVNLWFVRVVYERDALDDALDDWISSSDWRIALILQLAKFGVWLSRGVLFCLMLIAAALSAGLMRQMEFDADRYEYGLVGGKTFRETFEQMRLMSAAQHAAIQLMQQFSQSGHLADDLILIGEKLHAGLPADAKQELLRPIQEASGGWLDSHPPDASRIAKAQAVEGPGLFHLQRPARDLITHYDALCKGVTADFLRDQLGTHVMPDQLTPTAKLLAQTEA